MDIIKRVKALCKSPKYYGNVKWVSLVFVQNDGGDFTTKNYNVRGKQYVGELFDSSLHGWSISYASMKSIGEWWELRLVLMNTKDHSTNIGVDVIEVISTLSKR